MLHTHVPYTQKGYKEDLNNKGIANSHGSLLSGILAKRSLTFA